MRVHKNTVVQPEEVIKARKLSGLSQREASQLIYKTVAIWSRYERGLTLMDKSLFELFLLKTGQANVSEMPNKATVLAERFEKYGIRPKTSEAKLRYQRNYYRTVEKPRREQRKFGLGSDTRVIRCACEESRAMAA